MLGLALKKTLLDVWEHAAIIVTANVLLVTLGFALLLLVNAAAAHSLGFGAMSLAAALTVFAGILGVAAAIVEIVHNREAPDWRALRRAVRYCAGPAAIAGATALGLFSLVLFVAPAQPGPLTVMTHVVVLWVGVVIAEIFLFQLATTPLLGPGSALRNAIFLSFGNPGYSAGVLLLSAGFFCTAIIFFPGPLGALYLVRTAAFWRLADPADMERERRTLDRRGIFGTLFPWRAR